MAVITTIALDADDTLWQNEQFFRLTEQRFAGLLADYTDQSDLNDQLIAAVTRNLSFYDFGMKGFAVSIVETAREVTDHRVPGRVIAEILAAERELLNYPIETLPYVDQALSALSDSHRLILVTKGNIFDQERKLIVSGLAEYFLAIEIISDKNQDIYARIFAQHTDRPERTVMVGNSLRPDILSVLAADSYALYVPYNLTWLYEHADEPADQFCCAKIAHIGLLSEAVARLQTP
ncbi:MAG: HAD family hydrolase [Candidatus Devosia symbiotica]|nr:HAD family hydrolase [Candidatus Devosia symbiotica]